MTEEEKKSKEAFDPTNLSEEELEEIAGGIGGGFWRGRPVSPVMRERAERLHADYSSHMANGGTRDTWHEVLRTKYRVGGRSS